jgi:catechol-2,3-dioxygenase
VKGEPIRAGEAFHFGFRVESRSPVETWATHLGVPATFRGEDDFCARLKDPDGNTFEIYCDHL